MAEPEVSLHTATTPPPALKVRATTKKEGPALPPSDLMDLTETSGYLNKSRPWIYRAMRELGLPALRLGNRWAFQKSRLDNWLASQPSVNYPSAM